MKRPLVGLAILGITLLNFFQFPGHTWLQSDTQIYMPILEHMWDPTVLSKDLIAQHPHVAFTLYDETAIALGKVTGLNFRYVMAAQQFIYRALGIWGIYLIAAALGLADGLALLVTAVFSLGATIIGPAVLTFEYEPVPRGFAICFVFLAIGLAAHRRHLAAGVAASVAFLFHAPTVAPFWAVYFCLMVWTPEARRRRIALWPLAAAVLVLFVFSRFQLTGAETQPFFTRLDAAQEQLGRLRASYVWISLWWKDLLAHYLILDAATVLAYWRIPNDSPRELRCFLLGLPLLGVASMPASYLLLEKMHWALIPQVQPLRALLFVTAFAMILSAAAACRAIGSKRYAEALAWTVLAYLAPVNREIARPSLRRAALVIVLAVVTSAAIWSIEAARRWSTPALAAAILAPFILIPSWGRVENYPALHTTELAGLSAWARASTSRDAVFLFPDAEQDLYPGIFRAEALRAIYVDWKSGGQVNFFKDLGEEWWARWQKTMAAPFDAQRLPQYHDLGIDYVVVQAKNRMSARIPVFENAGYVAYKL